MHCGGKTLGEATACKDTCSTGMYYNFYCTIVRIGKFVQSSRKTKEGCLKKCVGIVIHGKASIRCQRQESENCRFVGIECAETQNVLYRKAGGLFDHTKANINSFHKFGMTPDTAKIWSW